MFWKQFNIKVMAEVMHRHFKMVLVYNLVQTLIIEVALY